jgi:hypothetical protein
VQPSLFENKKNMASPAGASRNGQKHKEFACLRNAEHNACRHPKLARPAPLKASPAY